LEDARDPAPGPALSVVAQDQGTSEGQSSSGRGLRIAGIATAAVGVAAGVLGALLYERGVNKLHDYQAAVNSNGTIPWNPSDQNWEQTRNAGVGLLIAGGVAAAGGVTLFMIGRHLGNDDVAGGQVSLAPNAGGAYFSYRTRF
jgi:hypothetical protein